MEEEDAIESRDILKTYFETGDVPTQEQFGSFIDSYVHRTDDNVTIYLEPGTTDKRFGIGTTAPEAPLGIKATGDEQLLAAFSKADEEDAKWFFDLSHGGFNIAEVTDEGNVSRLFIQELDGSVGIGTTSPNEKLHIENSSGEGVTSLRILNTATAINQGFGLGHEHNPDDEINGAFSIYENEFVQGNKRLTILPGGNVGINELIPDTKLHVSADLTVPQTDLDLIEGTGIVTIGPMTQNLVTDYRGIQARAGEYIGEELNLTASELNLQRIGGDILIHADDDNAESDKAIITKDARIGLGTMTPSERIEIDGAIKIGDSFNESNGTIRYTGDDFEGRLADEWISLTGGSGPVPPEGFWQQGTDKTIYYKADGNPRVAIGSDTALATLDVNNLEGVTNGSTAARIYNRTKTGSSTEGDNRVGVEIVNNGAWNPKGLNIGLFINEIKGATKVEANIAAVMNGNVVIGNVSNPDYLSSGSYRVLGIQNGTAPSAGTGISVQVYSADLDGTIIPTLHIMRGDGDIVKLYREKGLNEQNMEPISATTYGGPEAAVIESLRTRIMQLEARLIRIGLLDEPIVP